MTTRRFVMAAAFALVAAPSAFAAGKVHRLALQISDDTPDKMTAVLNVAANIARYYAGVGEEVVETSRRDLLRGCAEGIIPIEVPSVCRPKLDTYGEELRTTDSSGSDVSLEPRVRSSGTNEKWRERGTRRNRCERAARAPDGAALWKRALG